MTFTYDTDIIIASPNKEILILYYTLQHFCDPPVRVLQTVWINQHVECNAF